MALERPDADGLIMDRAALFVSAQPVEKKITAPDGTEISVHVREVADSDWMRYVAVSASNDPDVQGGARAFLISKGWVNADGSPAATLEEAANLRTIVARQFVSRIIELNAPDRERKGNA